MEPEIPWEKIAAAMMKHFDLNRIQLSLADFEAIDGCVITAREGAGHLMLSLEKL